MYRQSWLNDLPDLLRDMPLDQRQHMLFVHDGAPSHCQTVLESDIRWTVDSRWRPSQLVCTILCR